MLSDAIKRAEYDRDLKKFNLKDGQGLYKMKKPDRAGSSNRMDSAST